MKSEKSGLEVLAGLVSLAGLVGEMKTGDKVSIERTARGYEIVSQPYQETEETASSSKKPKAEKIQASGVSKGSRKRKGNGVYAGHKAELKVCREDRKWNIVHVDKDSLPVFPGYGVQFLLETPENGEFIMHLTGAPEGTKIGESNGGYLCHPRSTKIEGKLRDTYPEAVRRSFKEFYKAHPEIGAGSRIVIAKRGSCLYKLEEILPPEALKH